MAYKTLTYKITGVSPLIQHNGQLANPMCEWTKRQKAISGKRQKTDADLIEMARLEWYGGLYIDGGKVCIPGDVIEASLINAAKKQKLGRTAQSALYCPKNAILRFEGDDLTLDQMWEQGNHRLTARCRVGTASIMRTRPKFDQWTAEIEVVFDDEQLNERQITDIVRICGNVIGFCDWRPKFGRFEVAA